MRLHRARGRSRSALRTLAVFSGAFHPPTIAHLGMAREALSVAEEVLFTIPREFPHKEWEGATLDERLDWLDAATGGEPRFSIGVSDGGLLIDIARECRSLYGDAVRLLFLCGRDAAERIAAWDYGAREPFARQLDEYELLVAARNGEYEPPPELASRIHPLAMPASFDDVSSTAVRELRAAGLAWKHLVPLAVAARMSACPEPSGTA